jgi:hypothetical protein
MLNQRWSQRYERDFHRHPQGSAHVVNGNTEANLCPRDE